MNTTRLAVVGIVVGLGIGAASIFDRTPPVRDAQSPDFGLAAANQLPKSKTKAAKPGDKSSKPAASKDEPSKVAKPGDKPSKTPDAGDELIKRPKDRTPAPVAKSWKRIETWLAKNAPKIGESLRPPATPELIKEVEKTIGCSLPKDLRESYLIHDGQKKLNDAPGVLFGLRLRPLRDDEGVEWLWQHRTGDASPDQADEASPDFEDYTSFPEGAIRRSLMRKRWIPVHWNSGRDFFGVDLDPGPNGVVGQVIPFSYESGIGSDEKYVVAQSWAHFLEDVADEMEAGHVVNLPAGKSEGRFELKGAVNGVFYNAIPDWSRAKLPTSFQKPPKK